MPHRFLSLKFLCFAGLGVLSVALWFGLLKDMFGAPDRLVDYFQMRDAGAVGLFVMAHIVATILSLPGSILVIVGGAVFGLVWGTLWSVVGATLGAIAAFYLARYLLRDWVVRQCQHHSLFKSLDRAVRHNGLRCVFTVRFVPISPFSMVNFLFGITAIAPQPYAIGTFLGIIPGTILYTWLGVTGYEAAQGKGIGSFLLALTLLGLLSMVPLWARRREKA